MSGNELLIDTNIAIYLLNGDTTISNLLQGRKVYISFITELELLCSKSNSKQDIKKIELFLEHCQILDVNPKIKRLTVSIRKSHALKLPDAIVGATALYLECPILTADKAFGKIPEILLALYEPNGN